MVVVRDFQICEMHEHFRGLANHVWTRPALKNSISVWVERVPSPVNWADMPTRNVKIPLESLRFREFPKIDELIKMFLAQWSDDPRMFFEDIRRSRT